MTFRLEESLDLLARTPAVIDSILRNSSPAWHSADEGPSTWNPREIVAHLIQADETNWLPRARFILDRGDARPLEPFDRFAHLARFRDWSLQDLLGRFEIVRRDSLNTVRAWNLDEAQLSQSGQHPELGKVTLRQLLATWAVHDLDHIAQIVRVMATQYAEDVGPWRVNLSVLKPR
jgi:hypothetical protein